MELGKHTKALLSEVKMIVTVVNNRIDKKHVLDIRRSVFVNEQKVPINEEIDAYDESETVIHLLGKHENTPVAASRIRFVDDYAKLEDRKSTRLNSSHVSISYAVFCLKKKKITNED